VLLLKHLVAVAAVQARLRLALARRPTVLSFWNGKVNIMSKYARIENGIVIEVLDAQAGFTIGDMFHPDIAAQFVACDDDVEPNWTVSGNVFAAPVAPTVDLVAYAAAKRFDVETGGITVNGASIATDRDSQNMINGGYNYAQANPDKPIQFKAVSGWVELDHDTMVAIANAVGNHVQACFALESSVDKEIAAGTIKTTTEIDAKDWPS
jgi:hypothetical protein